MRRVAGMVLAAAIGVWSGTAFAQSATELAAAKQRFGEGLAQEKQGAFKDAAESFRAVAAIKQSPQVMYHLGHCEKESGKLVEAMIALERAIDLAKQTGTTDVEDAARPELEAVRGRIGKIDVKIEGGREPSSLSLDGASMAITTLRAPLLVNPGPHALVVGFGAGAEVKKDVTVGEGATATVAITPPPAAVASASPTEPARAAPPPVDAPPRAPSKIVPVVLLAGGGALLVVGGVLFAVARGTASDLESKCPDKVNCDPALQSDYDSGKLQNTLGLVLGGAGIVAAGAGVVLLFGSSGAASVQTNGRGAAVTVRF